MPLTKILFIAGEIEPFLNTSPIASSVRNLVEHIPKKEYDIRIFVPQFNGIASHLQKRIHEVVRLSGINISIGKEDISLVVKTASIKEAKLQIYFISNKDLFDKTIFFNNKDQKFGKANDKLCIFFCKGVLTAVKELEWTPDIMHCHGWFSSLAPMYAKTSFRKNPSFKGTQCLYTLYEDRFGYVFGSDTIKKIKSRQIQDEDLEPLGKADFKGFTDLAATHADAVTRTFDKSKSYPEPWLASLGATYIPQDNISHYLALYQRLREKKNLFLRGG